MKDWTKTRSAASISMGIALLALAFPARAEDGATNVAFSLDYAEWRAVAHEPDFALIDGSITRANDRDGLQLKAAAEVPANGDPAVGEFQARYFRSVAGGIDLIFGSRFDIAPGDDLAMAMLGAGFALPLGLQSEILLNLTENGDVLARTELVGTFALSPKVSVQPKVEVNWSPDGSEFAMGTGPEAIEAALRAGYAVGDVWTLYAGIIHGRAFGTVAAELRDAAEQPYTTTVTFGLSSAF
ncbi:copper resistance protein B [Croceicoccus naphthovorans]|uniref:copper resistance protein B n=1 Tax=Croceicoccus naphthovorans TaxID=1348774 RepID=UPI00146FE748|nr:copper resistance protein B [Croceicoccus naphthovorans]MBB3991511.1 copper resistance protein B [Croceicoccus naphthovorans]